MKKNSIYKWTVLAILILGTALLYYSNMIFAVRVDTLAKFGISQGQLTAISTIGCLPGAFLSVIVGKILDEKGIKIFTAVTLALTLACMIWRVYADSYAVLLIATVLIGTFLLPVTIAGPKMLGGLFEPSQIPLAMGFYGAAGGVGTTLAFATGNVYPSLETAFAGVSVCGAILLISWALIVKEAKAPASAEPKQGNGKGSLGSVLKSKNMLKVMFCSGFAVGASLLINTYLVQAFVAKGLDPAAASSVGTVMNLCLIIGGILSGAVIAKIGLINLPYTFICVVGGALVLLAYFMPFGGFTYVLVGLAGIIMSGSVGVSFTRIPLLPLTGDFEPEAVGTATGMNQTAIGIMSFALPTIIATIAGDNYKLVFIIAFIFLVLVALVGLTIPELGQKGKLAQHTEK